MTSSTWGVNNIPDLKGKTYVMLDYFTHYHARLHPTR